MIELISTYGLSTVVIILLAGIPCIIGFISWCKKIWNNREAFKKEQRNLGRAQEREEEAEEQRFTSGETRIAQLELLVEQQAEMIKELKQITKRLEKSDRLAIKTYIKEQHDIWVPKGCIDGQVLELLEERFKIYQAEGGNSWAEKLMTDMRALPIVVVVPVAELDNK